MSLEAAFREMSDEDELSLLLNSESILKILTHLPVEEHSVGPEHSAHAAEFPLRNVSLIKVVFARFEETGFTLQVDGRVELAL